ncbi:hypothetical protein AAFF_G00367110 [Aldrovandia affinis]|uniref:Uncharacterized protein n=1 Tax=Aldrovandia affinis TaxID=143900 RepID=A0AAD7WMX5_9TELE|nr:hypothetical protein AAFF_G00367110 [Aldrovandia affinis]
MPNELNAKTEVYSTHLAYPRTSQSTPADTVGTTPPGAQNVHRTAMSVQDLSHRQTPQSTSPVEVVHHCHSLCPT